MTTDQKVDALTLALPTAEAAAPPQEPAAELPAEKAEEVVAAPPPAEQTHSHKDYVALQQAVERAKREAREAREVQAEIVALKQQGEVIMNALAGILPTGEAVEPEYEVEVPKARKPSPIEAYRQTLAQAAMNRTQAEMVTVLTEAGLKWNDLLTSPDFAKVRRITDGETALEMLRLVLKDKRPAPEPPEKPPVEEEVRQRMRQEGLLRVEAGGPTASGATKEKILDDIRTGRISAVDGTIRLKKLGFSL